MYIYIYILDDCIRMWKLLYKLVGFQRRLTDRWSSDHPGGKSKSLVSQWSSPSTFDDLGLNWSEFWGSPVALGHPIYVFLWCVVFAWFHFKGMIFTGPHLGDSDPRYRDVTVQCCFVQRPRCKHPPHTAVPGDQVIRKWGETWWKSAL